MKNLIILFSCLILSCSQQFTPTPRPDSDLCAKMCQHIGPKEKGGLDCEEGEPVYDSDKPGPKDVPNQSCEEFCKVTQENGIFMNPACVLLVERCDQIEEARLKDPKTCKE